MRRALHANRPRGGATGGVADDATAPRELDRRSFGAVEIRLLWRPERDTVTILLENERNGRAVELTVHASEAVEALEHPFVYLDAADPSDIAIYERRSVGGRPAEPPFAAAWFGRGLLGPTLSATPPHHGLAASDLTHTRKEQRWES
jgi:hypothetical protein